MATVSYGILLAIHQLYLFGHTNPPFPGRFRYHPSNSCGLCHETPFEENNCTHSIKEPVSIPAEGNVDIVSIMHYLDAPKWLWNKILYPIIALNDEAQSRELT